MTKDFLAMSFEQQLQRHINDTENNKEMSLLHIK